MSSIQLSLSYQSPPPPYKLSKLNSSGRSFHALTLHKRHWGDLLRSMSFPSNLMPNPRNKMTCNGEADGWETIYDSVYIDEEGKGEDDMTEFEYASPWEGAIVYKRDASITHVEYCTTLERLGLAKVSTEISRSRASAMGLRVTKAVKDYPLGTPVQVSLDVTRKKMKLRLDGIIKTILTLTCLRCGKPTPAPIFSNFSLLLTEEDATPEEAEGIDMGVLYGEGKSKFSSNDEEKKDDEDEDEDASIESDDRLCFRREDKEIDISKNIRDLVHVEISLDAVCDAACKGVCVYCGINHNFHSCKCHLRHLKVRETGPLGDLKDRIEQAK